jgi:PDZ domain
MFRANSSPFLLSDAGNGLWQGYAAIGHERIADALLAQAELGEAGDEYRKELAILAPLVESNPTIERKIFLAGAHFKLGEVLQRQALLPDAAEHFNQSLAITEPLGSANPEFIGYQVFMHQTRLRISQANDRPGEAETTLGSLHKLRDERRLTFEQRKWLSDIDGSPNSGNSGSVKITHVYDASGKETERVFVDANGKPTAVQSGYARLIFERDITGREIHARYFDPQDREIPMELVVLKVQPNSTAERIGLKAGDRILSYDGKVPTSTNQFTDLVTDATGASSRTVVVRRNSQSLTFTVPPGRLGINIDMTQADTASGNPAQEIAAPPPIAQAPTQK